MLDKCFIPIETKLREYEASARNGEPFAISVIRSDKERYTFCTRIVNPTSTDTVKYVERLTRAILYIVGGYIVELGGNAELGNTVAQIFSSSGSRSFDAEFMATAYECPFEVRVVPYSEIKPSADCPVVVGGKTSGARIGFDAGGSDRKVSAMLNGEIVYSEEVVWSPKLNSDPNYHIGEIRTALRTAASHLPKVDSVGVSTAGIVINNEMRIASLFLLVSKEDWQTHVKHIYSDCVRDELGEGIPTTVANDGDVTALAGAISLGSGGVLGIAMGTSQACGYIGVDGALNGWLNELAFVPIDYNEKSMVDEWCGDYGCGVKYFSQDGVIKLAEMAGIQLVGTPAEKLKQVQSLLEKADTRIPQIYEMIGYYLAHSLAFYTRFYKVKYLLLLGRVMSGKGGDIILSSAEKTLAEAYPELSVQLTTPDEKMRRVGQSIAACEL